MKNALPFILVLVFISSCRNEDVLSTLEFPYEEKGKKYDIILKHQRVTKQRHKKGETLFKGWDEAEWEEVVASVKLDTSLAEDVGTIAYRTGEEVPSLENVKAELKIKVSEDGNILALGHNGYLMGMCSFANGIVWKQDENYNMYNSLLDDKEPLRFDSLNMREQIVNFDDMPRGADAEALMLHNEEMFNTPDSVFRKKREINTDYINGKISFEEYRKKKEELKKKKR